MYEMNGTYTIWNHRLEDLVLAVNTANNKAKIIGNGGFKLDVSEKRLHEYTFVNEGGAEQKRYGYVVDVTISGEYPHISGWSLIAVNNHIEDSDRNIISRFPWTMDDDSVVIPARYRTTDSKLCEECGVSRERVATYIIANEDGEYRQVGSTCLKSYTGNASVARLVNIISSIEYVFANLLEMSDLRDPGRRAPMMFKTEKVLATTAAVIEKLGWVSRRTARDTFRRATADLVYDMLTMKQSDLARTIMAGIKVEKSHNDKATDVLDWLTNMAEMDGLTDYYYNLVALGVREVVEPKFFGMLCSAITAYDKLMQARAERAARVNEHFGEIGSRYATTKTAAGAPVEMTIAYTAGPYENQFGVSFRNVLHDADGRTFVWWTGSNLEYMFSRGALLTMSFTVKSHDEYEGTMQTVISRAKYPEEPTYESDGGVSF